MMLLNDDQVFLSKTPSTNECSSKSSDVVLHDSIESSHIFHRNLHSEPLNIVSGSGISFTLSDGRTILDASCGPAVSVLGHSRPDISAAITQQLSQIAYTYSGSQYTSSAAEKLSSILLKDRPGGLSKAIFVNSGSEATDAALKLATQYWIEKGEKPRTRFIARNQSYHGNTLGALCVSGHRSRREMYEVWMSQNVSFVDPCYAYRGKYGNESDVAYVSRLENQLDDEFQRLGPENVAAFIMEPVSGSTLGCVPPVPGYMAAMRRVCDRYGALLILDEIMCGMGKTGSLHAWQDERDFRGPDLQTIGKALAGGFVPLSAVLVHDKVFRTLANGSGSLMHGHTFQAHPLACSAAVAVQEAIVRDDLLANVREMGKLLENELHRQLDHLWCVGDIRGRGLFWSVEFVRDRVTKQPFEPSEQFCQQVVAASLERGVNILGNLGETGEHYVDHVIISPPYIVTEDEIRTIVRRIRGAVDAVSLLHENKAVDSPRNTD